MEPELAARIQDRVGKLTQQEVNALVIIYNHNPEIKKVIDGLMRPGGHFSRLDPVKKHVDIKSLMDRFNEEFLGAMRDKTSWGRNEVEQQVHKAWIRTIMGAFPVEVTYERQSDPSNT